MDSTGLAVAKVLSTPSRAACPPWCATRHGMHLGEEDWIHLSEPLPLTDGVSAQLRMSIDPDTHTQDGPYVVVGGTEYTLTKAQALAASLMAMATDSHTHS